MLRLRGVALAIALIATGCASAQRQVPDDGQLAEADRVAWTDAARALDQGLPALALERLERPLSVEPWHVPSHLLRQDALRMLGRETEVSALYASGLAEEETSSARVLLAHRALPGSFPERRSAGYLRAFELDTESPWPRLALCYDALRQGVDALAAARTAAQMGFTQVEDLQRATAGNALQQAEAHARGALSSRTDLALAHAAVADAILADPSAPRRPARLSEALAAAEAAARLDPGNARVLVVQARARRASGDDAGAVESLERALEVTDGALEIAAYIGRVLLDLRRDDEARDHLERAAAGDLPHVSVLLNLGVAEFRLEEFELAAAAFERARSVAPGDSRPLEGLALARARLGDRGAATAATREYLELGGGEDPAGLEFIERMEDDDAPLPPPQPVLR